MPEDRFYRSTCVFMLIFNMEDPHLLAIQKTDSEGYPWRNQVALPGGHAEETDETPLETAFRELEEELGIFRDEVEVMGSMGHFQTINRVDIEVFVGLWGEKRRIRFDTSEISRVLKIPLSKLFHIHCISDFHGRNPDTADLIYPVAGAEIWGATARILYHFFELMYPLFDSLFNKKIESDGTA